MPYADPEKRRQFHREYKRKWRKSQARNQLLKGVRIFVCPRFPSLSVGLAYFEGGFLITKRDDVVQQVMQHPEYGRFIFPVLVDFTLTATEGEDE